MLGRVLCSTSSLVLFICLSLNVEAVEQHVKRHQNDDWNDRHGDVASEADQDDDQNSDDGDGSLLSESQSGRGQQVPTATDWDSAVARQQKEKFVETFQSKPIKVHWLWHQSMCLEADLLKITGHDRNIHLAECRDPIPPEQIFDYMPATYQIRLHHDGGKYCLDRDGDNLIFNICKTANVAGQRFVFDAGTDHIRNAKGGSAVECLTIAAGEARHGDLYVNGTNVELKPCIASETDQKFKPANLISMVKINKSIAEVVNVEQGSSSSFEQLQQQRHPQAKPVEAATSAALPARAAQPLYYSMPQPVPQYYQPAMYPGVAYPQYQNPMMMSPMMPAAMPQVVAQGGMAVAPTMAATNPQVPSAMSTTTQRRQKTAASSSLASIKHEESSPAAPVHSSNQDKIDVPSTESLINKASETPSPASGDAMFKDIDHLLDPIKTASSVDQIPFSQASASSEADNSFGVLSPDLNDHQKPSEASINSILGDLSQAGKEMASGDESGSDKAIVGDDMLSSESLLETKRERASSKQKAYSRNSVEVGSGAMMRRT